MSTTVATATAPAPVASEPAITTEAPAAGIEANVDDATYMMNTFSTLLEGDLYDDELNEITTLFAPAVSDDEKSASDSPVTTVDYENHPGAQVALTAAAIDSAIKTKIQPLKRKADSALEPPAHKRRVTLDNTKRITFTTSCGSLDNLPAVPAPVSAPVSPKSVVTPAAVVPFSPVSASGVAVPDATVAPQIPPAKTTTKPKKTTKAPPTITIRQGMTPEEKAKACRERNREHARKTRLRKKAYVDELKRSLNDMVEQRDTNQALEEQKAKILQQNRDVRFQVMQDFLNCRGNNERNPDRWAAILVPEEFNLKMPATDFQTMVSPTEGSQVLVGVSDVMSDASYFSSFLQTLNTSDETAAPVYFVYQCDRDSYIMDGCQAMFNFEATSLGAGAVELTSSGTFRATFCAETNRLRSAQFVFDTGSIRFQLEKMSK